MASRDGKTVDGTDGSDFSHRERVVSNYYVSNPEAIKEEPIEEAIVNGAVADAAADVTQLAEDLPLAGDYSGIGGPETVPLESPGAFEKPMMANTFLNDLFMAPTDEALAKFQKTEMRRSIAKSKRNLKAVIAGHIMAGIILLAKLSPAIFDKLDVFILALEELNIPEPKLWEWIWLSGVLLIPIVGFNAIKSSKVSRMRIFAALVLLLGLLPIFYVVGYFFSDITELIMTEPKSRKFQMFKGYPLAVLWYIFAVLVFNIHCFEVYYARVLLNAWAPKQGKKSN